eukprot:487222-Heterocapsa_arctica.AAC.1
MIGAMSMSIPETCTANVHTNNEFDAGTGDTTVDTRHNERPDNRQYKSRLGNNTLDCCEMLVSDITEDMRYDHTYGADTQ